MELNSLGEQEQKIKFRWEKKNQRIQEQYYFKLIKWYRLKNCNSCKNTNNLKYSDVIQINVGIVKGSLMQVNIYDISSPFLF